MPSYTSSALHRHVQGLQQDAPVLQKAKLPLSPKASTDRNQRVPTEVPPFTVADLRRAIPAHCFVQNHFLSFSYLFVDLAIVAALFWVATHIDTTFTEASFGKTALLLRYAAWSTYWFVQGAIMTGLWVIGHECGHGGFSSSAVIGDSVGWVVHSALLVPYFSWKISHRRHHSNTGNLAKDEVFVPPTEEEFDMDNVLWWSAPGRIIQIGMFATIGWFLYLFVNATGRPYPGQKWYNVNHFMPWSPIFSAKERLLIVLSDLGLALFIYGLYQIAQATSFYAVFHYYLIPYMIVNFWLVTITLLQHTDTILPHYSASEWDWLRGALATIDRSYGWLNIAQHHIQDTHIAHHLFSTIPHYYAQEATEAIKGVIGSYYRYEDLGVMGVPGALWKCYQTCHYVAPDKTKDAPKGVMWFHSIDEGRKNRSK